jgi:hypothetical protein
MWDRKSISHSYPEKIVVYFDTMDRVVVFRNSTQEDYNLSQLKSETNFFVYFDQRHTIGTNLDLPSTSRGILTIDINDQFSPIAQGLFRMREIMYYQHCDYAVKSDLHAILSEGVSEQRIILENLLVQIALNEEESFGRSKEKFLQQNILTQIRSASSYDAISYRLRTFVPNMDMTDEILRTYYHPYQREDFLRQIIQLVTDHVTDSDRADIGVMLSELEGIYESLDPSESSGILAQQKQVVQSREADLELEREKNNLRDFEFKLIIFSTKATYANLINTLASRVDYHADDIKLFIPMIQILGSSLESESAIAASFAWKLHMIYDLNMEVTKGTKLLFMPCAIKTIYSIISHDSELDRITDFYLIVTKSEAIPDSPELERYTLMVATSTDLLFIDQIMEELLPTMGTAFEYKVIKLDEYKSYEQPSIQRAIHLIRLLLMRPPTINEIDTVRLSGILEGEIDYRGKIYTVKELVKKYYTQFHNYSLEGNYPSFLELLNSEETVRAEEA